MLMDATEAFDVLGSCLAADGWDFQPSAADGLYFTGFMLGTVRIPCVAKIWPETNRFVFYVLLPYRVPVQQRLVAAEFLTQVNYGLQIGNFEMDFTDGEVRYKSSVGFSGDDLSPALIQQAVYPAVKTVETLFPELLEVMAGSEKMEKT